MKWILGLVVIVALAGAAIFTLRVQAAKYEKEAIAAEIRNLRSIESVLASGSSPQTADVAVGFSEHGLSSALETLTGVEANSNDLGGVVLRVVRSQLKVGRGNVEVFLDVLISRKDVPIEATVTTTSVLLIDRIDLHDRDEGVSHADYRLSVREVGAKLGFSLFALETRRWVNAVIASNLPKQFAESLTLSLPLYYPMDVPLGFDVEETEKTDAGEYTVRYSMPRSRLLDRAAFRLTPGIPARDGIWFLGSVSTAVGDVSPPADQENGETSPEVLESLRLHIAELVAGFPELGADIALFANASLFDKAVSAFNDLPAASRRISAQLVSRKGDLASDYNEVAVVGKGGYSASFKDNTSLRGTLAIPLLEKEWKDGKGLTLNGRAEISASADVRLHIDPYVGGGFSISLGIDGKASVPLRTSIDLRKIVLGEDAAVVIGPAIACEQFPLTLEGGGEIRFGVKSFELIGDKQPDPLVILSSDVSTLPLTPEAKGGVLDFPRRFWAAVRVQPVVAASQADGYRVSANVASTLTTEQPPQPGDTLLQQKAADLWKQQVQTKCPADKEAVFLFAGAEFGPNNEIVKALKVLFEAGKKAKENVEVSWERVERVIKDPRQAPAVAREVANNVLREAGNAVNFVTRPFRRLFHR